MTADTFRDFLKQSPFVPFKIHMNDGRRFEVPHPDFVAMHPSSTAMAIVFGPKGRFDFVYIRNVTSIEGEGPVPPALPKRRRKRDQDDDDADSE